MILARPSNRGTEIFCKKVIKQKNKKNSLTVRSRFLVLFNTLSKTHTTCAHILLFIRPSRLTIYSTAMLICLYSICTNPCLQVHRNAIFKQKEKFRTVFSPAIKSRVLKLLNALSKTHSSGAHIYIYIHPKSAGWLYNIHHHAFYFTRHVCRYKEALMSLVSHILQKLMFKFSQSQLEELDDDTLDYDVRIHLGHGSVTRINMTLASYF